MSIYSNSRNTCGDAAPVYRHGDFKDVQKTARACKPFGDARPNEWALKSRFAATADAIDRQARFADEEGLKSKARKLRIDAERYRRLAQGEATK